MKELVKLQVLYNQKVLDVFLSELDKALKKQDEIDRKAGVFKKIKRPLKRKPLTTIKR